MYKIDNPKEYAIRGAIIEVYRTLGNGFLEAVYQKALEVEFGLRGIPFRSQVEIPVIYKGVQLGFPYIADFICYDEIILELKAAEQTCHANEAQLLNYLHASGKKIGLLVNFGHCPKATIQRLVI